MNKIPHLRKTIYGLLSLLSATSLQSAMAAPKPKEETSVSITLEDKDFRNAKDKVNESKSLETALDTQFAFPFQDRVPGFGFHFRMSSATKYVENKTEPNKSARVIKPYVLDTYALVYAYDKNTTISIGKERVMKKKDKEGIEGIRFAFKKPVHYVTGLRLITEMFEKGSLSKYKGPDNHWGWVRGSVDATYKAFKVTYQTPSTAVWVPNLAVTYDHSKSNPDAYLKKASLSLTQKLDKSNTLSTPKLSVTTREWKIDVLDAKCSGTVELSGECTNKAYKDTLPSAKVKVKLEKKLGAADTSIGITLFEYDGKADSDNAKLAPGLSLSFTYKI